MEMQKLKKQLQVVETCGEMGIERAGFPKSTGIPQVIAGLFPGTSCEHG